MKSTTRKGILLCALASAPIFLLGQTAFDQDLILPGDTMTSPGIEMHAISAANGDLIIDSYHELQNGAGPAVNTGLIHRLDLDGSSIWRRKIDTPNNSYFRLGGVRELGNGSLVATAVMNSIGHGLYMRFDQNGDLQASREYQAGTFAFSLFDAAPLNDSTMLLLSSVFDPFVGSLIARTNNDGDVLDASIVHQPGAGGSFDKLTPCAHGGYLLSGRSARSVNPDTTLYSVLLGRVDSTGELLWAERLEERTPSGLFSVAGVHQLPDGSLRVFVHSRRAGNFQSDTWVIALNADGGILWKERIRFPFLGSGFNAVASMSVGDTAFWLVGGYNPIGRAAVVIDSSGTVTGTGATSQGDFIPPYNGTIAADGQLVTLSLHALPGAGTGEAPRVVKDAVMPTLCSPYTFTVAYDTLGLDTISGWSIAPMTVNFSDASSIVHVVSEVPVVVQNCVITSTHTTQAAASLGLQPVPASDHVTVIGTGVQQIELFDGSGRMVRSQMFAPTDALDLDLRGLSPGLYHVRALQDGAWRMLRLVKE